MSERTPEHFLIDSWQQLRKKHTGPRWLRSIAVDALVCLEAERERVRQMEGALRGCVRSIELIEAAWLPSGDKFAPDSFPGEALAMARSVLNATEPEAEEGEGGLG